MRLQYQGGIHHLLQVLDKCGWGHVMNSAVRKAMNLRLVTTYKKYKRFRITPRGRKVLRQLDQAIPVCEKCNEHGVCLTIGRCVGYFYVEVG